MLNSHHQYFYSYISVLLGLRLRPNNRCCNPFDAQIWIHLHHPSDSAVRRRTSHPGYLLQTRDVHGDRHDEVALVRQNHGVRRFPVWRNGIPSRYGCRDKLHHGLHRTPQIAEVGCRKVHTRSWIAPGVRHHAFETVQNRNRRTRAGCKTARSLNLNSAPLGDHRHHANPRRGGRNVSRGLGRSPKIVQTPRSVGRSPKSVRARSAGSRESTVRSDHRGYQSPRIRILNPDISRLLHRMMSSWRFTFVSALVSAAVPATAVTLRSTAVLRLYLDVRI